MLSPEEVSNVAAYVMAVWAERFGDLNKPDPKSAVRAVEDVLKALEQTGFRVEGRHDEKKD